MKTLTTMQECIELSLKSDGSQEYDCDIKLPNGSTAYTVAISYRDLLFYCEDRAVTYLVDSYGNRHIAVFYDEEMDE